MLVSIRSSDAEIEKFFDFLLSFVSSPSVGEIVKHRKQLIMRCFK